MAIPRFFSGMQTQPAINQATMNPGEAYSLTQDSTAGAGMSLAGNILQEQGHKMQVEAAKNYAATEGLKAQVAMLNNYDAQRKNISDPMAFQEHIQNFNQDVLKGVSDKAPNKIASQMVQDHLSQIAGRMAIGAQQESMQYQKQLQVQGFSSAVDQMANRTLQNPLEAATHISQASHALSEMSLDPLAKEKLNKQLDQIRISQIQGLASQDPQLALEALKNPDITNNLRPDALRTATTHVMHSVDSFVKQNEKQAQVAEAKARFFSGQTMNPADSFQNKIVDNMYEDLSSQAKDLPSKLQLIQQMVSTNTSIMPKLLKGDLEAGIMRGKPSEQVGYADIISKMNQTQAQRMLLNNLDDKVVMRALDINSEMMRTLDKNPNDALASVNARLAPVLGEQTTARLEDLKTLKQDGNALDPVQIDSTLSSNFDKWNTFSPDQASRARVAFEKEFRSAYLQGVGVDAKLASQMALSKVGRQFGTTKINGSNELMENAPNMLLDDNSRLKDYYHNTLKSVDPEYASNDGKINYNGKQVQTIVGSDLQTKSTGTYPIQYVDQNGLKRNLVQDIGGVQVPVRLNVKTESLRPSPQDMKINAQIEAQRQSNNVRSGILLKNTDQTIAEIKQKLDAAHLSAAPMVKNQVGFELLKQEAGFVTPEAEHQNKLAKIASQPSISTEGPTLGDDISAGWTKIKNGLMNYFNNEA